MPYHKTTLSGSSFLQWIGSSIAHKGGAKSQQINSVIARFSAFGHTFVGASLVPKNLLKQCSWIYSGLVLLVSAIWPRYLYFIFLFLSKQRSAGLLFAPDWFCPCSPTHQGR